MKLIIIGYALRGITFFLFEEFDEEADWAEAVVAGDEGGLGVFHPAVVEVGCAVGESHYEWGDSFPGA